MDLQGNPTLVTGAAMGIGRGIATVLAGYGAKVVVADIDGDAAERTAKEISDAGNTAVAVTMDVREPMQVEAALGTLEQRFGPVEITVNNAGNTSRQPFLEMELQFFEWLIRLNLTSVFICGQAAARRMVAAGTAGRIVTIASNSGLFGGIGRAAYSPSKAGIIALTQSMAMELAPHGTRVNAVAPGPIKIESQPADLPDPAFLRRMSLERFGTPAEIGETVAFLASDRASFTTGHCYTVDGGLTVSGIKAG